MKSPIIRPYRRSHRANGRAPATDYFMVVKDQTDKSKIGFIYRIRSASQRAVKVGFASDVDHGYHSLKSGNPAKLEIAEQYRCTEAGEKAFHRAFKAHRVHLEWYHDNE